MHIQGIMDDKVFFFTRTMETNIGTQTFKCKCTIDTYSIDEYTLLERYILKEPKYFRRLEINFIDPIKFNSDREYSGAYTDSGNDATYSISIFLDNEKDKIVTADMIAERLDETISTFSYNVNRVRISEKEEKKSKLKKFFNRRKTFWFKSGHNHYLNVESYLSTYPFKGDALSGLTSILGFSIKKDVDSSYIFKMNFSLLGLHLSFLYSNFNKEGFIRKLPIKDSMFNFNLNRAEGFRLEIGGKNPEWKYEWKPKVYKLCPWRINNNVRIF